MRMLSGQPEAIALQALRLYTDRLMGQPGVVGLALETDSRAGGDELYVVKVYVSKDRPAGAPPRREIPSALTLRPSALGNTVRVPTRIEEIGEIQLDTIF